MGAKERKPKGYWTYEKCQEETLKYTNKLNTKYLSDLLSSLKIIHTLYNN